MKNYLIIEFDDSNCVERILVDRSFFERAEHFLLALHRRRLLKKVTKVNLRDFIISSLL